MPESFVTDTADLAENSGKSIAEMVIFLKSKINAAKEKAKALFVNFANQTLLKPTPDLRTMLNRVRDELRHLNPQHALLVNGRIVQPALLNPTSPPEQTDLA